MIYVKQTSRSSYQMQATAIRIMRANHFYPFKNQPDDIHTSGENSGLLLKPAHINYYRNDYLRSSTYTHARTPPYTRYPKFSSSKTLMHVPFPLIRA